MTAKAKFKREHDLFELPRKATEGSACFDLQYCGDKKLTIYPHNQLIHMIRRISNLQERRSRVLVPLGFSIELSPDYELQIRPRSGLAYKHGVTVINAPGTIDSDYRGVVRASMINLGESRFDIEPGMRICQGQIVALANVDFSMEDELTVTERDTGGIGHTGL